MSVKGPPYKNIVLSVGKLTTCVVAGAIA